jgi:hypothetical protein
VSAKPHAERLARNDESRNKAGHHREPWSVDEVDFLMQWDPAEGDGDLIIIAECLGRTIEACRQRFYEVKRGEVHVFRSKTTTVTVTKTTTAQHDRYIGTNDDDDQWWSPDYYTKEK